ncbi:MAG: HAMP domain-containing histidine kinase [Nitrospirales bacterium]|nr:HAMP domain-containing histidine kinase [Nitrospirales bacterium]
MGFMARFGIFNRLFLGFLAVLLPLVAANTYIVAQLKSLTDVTQRIMSTDNRLISTDKRMADTLLSEIRYERKYVILKDEALYEQFFLSGRDFEKYLAESVSIAGSAESKKALATIGKAHSRYREIFREEAELLMSRRSYSASVFSQEKQKEVNAIFDELRRMRDYSQIEIHQKLSGMEESIASSHRLAGQMVWVALLWGLLVAIWIARGISRPISRVIDKTREVSRGVFSGDLRLTSPPEMAELAQAFNAMCDRLAEVDRMKSDFFSSMSHELRTPLTSIKMGTSQLREGIGGSLSEKQERIMTIIAEECDRLIGLINSLLDLSKMEAGMVRFNLSESDIVPILWRACELIEPLARAKEISLVREIPEIMPAVVMDGDRVLQAVLNFLGNAVKFTPQGGQVTVSCRENDGTVEVSVSDTGTGIPKEELSFVFDKFHQTSSSLSYQLKGTGLGLAIAKQIITAHGGRIWAESSEGQGSSFIFSLPLH